MYVSAHNEMALISAAVLTAAQSPVANLHIKEFAYERRLVPNIRLEGVLVSLITLDETYIYPKGSFTCGCCGDACSLDDRHHGRYHIPTMTVFCPGCAHQTQMSANQQLGLQQIRLFVDLDMVVPYEPWMETLPITDKREEEGEFKQRWNEKIKQIAASNNNDFIYCDGLTMDDLKRRYFGRKLVKGIEKRFLRRWKGRTRFILEYCAKVGKDMAAVWTDSKMVM